jgi:hypothetical protein
MEKNRDIIENRIFEIIQIMKNSNLEFLLNKNLNLFSEKELQIILNFLESWDLSYIYKFLDEKYKEYLELIEEIKQIKIKSKKVKNLIEEEKEKENEIKQLENLLNF